MERDSTTHIDRARSLNCLYRCEINENKQQHTDYLINKSSLDLNREILRRVHVFVLNEKYR